MTEEYIKYKVGKNKFMILNNKVKITLSLNAEVKR